MRLNPQSLYMTVLITSLVATGPLSTDMYLPALPAIRTAFGVDTFAVQLTLSVFLLGLACAQLILGPVSDKFGRRPVLLGGFALYFIASVACAVASNIEFLILARFFQAIGVCAGGVVGRAVVRDVHGPEHAVRMLAFMSSAIAIAPLLAPLIGGQLTLTLGWTSVFWTMSVIAAVLLLITLLTLPETNLWTRADALNPKRFARNYGSLLKDGAYRSYMLAGAFNFSGLFAFISGASFVLIEDLGLDVEFFGFAFGFVVIGFMVGAQISGHFAKRVGIARMVEWGGRLAIVSGSIGLTVQFFVPPSVFSVIIPMALYLVSVGLVLPNAMAGAIAPHQDMAGAASALFGFVQMAMAGCVGMLVGRLHDGTPVPMMAIITACGVLGWLFTRHPQANA
ncbi:MAG: multidrug effflux MFS transporter [Magnetovibrio sp.]|nr:multidrug effflux MFS transporter [Magnetovibrio sp.]